METVDQCKLSLVAGKSYEFENQISNDEQKGGTTFFVLLKESHISIHTWPEEQSMVIDIFTCGDTNKAYQAMEYLLNQIEYKAKDLKKIGRGSIE